MSDGCVVCGVPVATVCVICYQNQAAELAQLRADLAHRIGWQERAERERDEAWAERERLRAKIEAMRGSLTDFANPDHWTKNDDGEWIWYGAFPPFERPAFDLMGPLDQPKALG